VPRVRRRLAASGRGPLARVLGHRRRVGLLLPGVRQPRVRRWLNPSRIAGADRPCVSFEFGTTGCYAAVPSRSLEPRPARALPNEPSRPYAEQPGLRPSRCRWRPALALRSRRSPGRHVFGDAAARSSPGRGWGTEEHPGHVIFDSNVVAKFALITRLLVPLCLRRGHERCGGGNEDRLAIAAACAIFAASCRKAGWSRFFCQKERGGAERVASRRHPRLIGRVCSRCVMASVARMTHRYAIVFCCFPVVSFESGV
jgi:hypothetical protein